MANENAKIVRQQGASELSVRSGGSVTVEAGGVVNVAGKLATTGVVTQTGALTQSSTLDVSSGGSVTIKAGAALFIGTVRIETGGSNPNHAGSPGDIYIVSNGIASNWFVNIASGVSGKSWASGVEVI